MSGEFGTMLHPRARREYRCEWCYGPIPKGEEHCHYVGMFDHVWQDWRMHNECEQAYTDAHEPNFDGFEPGTGEAPARIWELINSRADVKRLQELTQEALHPTTPSPGHPPGCVCHRCRLAVENSSKEVHVPA